MQSDKDRYLRWVWVSIPESFDVFQELVFVIQEVLLALFFNDGMVSELAETVPEQTKY